MAQNSNDLQKEGCHEQMEQVNDIEHSVELSILIFIANVTL
tara:strand:- start:540 stop:662 length:123 start_codon:yes stop_codon:yes gene_type:complete